MEKTIRLTRVKETKRMVVFEEHPAPGEAPIVRNIYVEKWFAGDGKEVELTISVKER